MDFKLQGKTKNKSLNLVIPTTGSAVKTHWQIADKIQLAINKDNMICRQTDGIA